MLIGETTGEKWISTDYLEQVEKGAYENRIKIGMDPEDAEKSAKKYMEHLKRCIGCLEGKISKD